MAGLEEKERLQQERLALMDTVRKLHREVSKLDWLKRSMMQSLAVTEEKEVRGWTFPFS